MKHIILLILFILLFKLSTLFIVLNQGLWSLANIWFILGFIFFLYLIYSLFSSHLANKTKFLFVLILFLFASFSVIGWNNNYKSAKNLNTSKNELLAISNQIELKNFVYDKLLITLNNYYQSNQKSNLNNLFLMKKDWFIANTNPIRLNTDNKNFLIFADTNLQNNIIITAIDTSCTGISNTYKNYNKIGNGYPEFKATLTLAGITYERKN